SHPSLFSPHTLHPPLGRAAARGSVAGYSPVAVSVCKFRTGPRVGVGEMENHREHSARGRWPDGKCQERVTVLTIVYSRHPRGIGEPARIADWFALRQSRHARTLVVGAA